MQLTLADIKARIDRPDRLARGLAKEAELQRGAEGVLLFRERRQYLAAVQDALAGADAARVMLENNPVAAWAGARGRAANLTSPMTGGPSAAPSASPPI
jgi:hypothetical protein